MDEPLDLNKKEPDKMKGKRPPPLTILEEAGLDIEQDVFYRNPNVGLYFLEEESLEGLNVGQREMVEKINVYINKPYNKNNKKYFLVQGSGGTGKSFAILRAIQSIGTKSVVSAAPSHFAKNVLQNFLGETYTVITIAALLAKKVSYDTEGKQVLVPIYGKTPPLVNYSVVILDEGSMVDDETVEEVLELAHGHRIKVIVLGDFCQLPPVNQETDSSFFDSIDIELTQTMRFKGPLFHVTGLIRAEIVKIREGFTPALNILNIATNRCSDINELGSGYIFLNNMTTVINAAVRRFKKEKGVDYVRIIAYRNKTIDKLNTRIREQLYGGSPKQFEEGEIVINNGGFRLSKNKVINNGEIFKVRRSLDMTGPYEIPCKLLYLDSIEIKEGITVIADDGKFLYDKTLKSLVAVAKKSKQWKAVFKFKESFAYFNYAYACSTHKSQGSSINHVFVIEEDIYDVKMTSAKEKLQSLYVATTRASFRAYIYNSKFKVDNSTLVKEHLIKDYGD